MPTRFADVARIRALSGQDFVPIIEHDDDGGARQLVDRVPSGGPVSRRPSLFGGAVGRGAARLVNIWSDTVLGRAMRPLIYADFIRCIDPGDRAYFRGSREAQLGMTLEQYSADRDAALPELHRSLRAAGTHPVGAAVHCRRGAGLRRLHRVLGVPVGAHRQLRAMCWTARSGWTRRVPGATRMVALHEDLGNRFALYPKESA